jgi:hypothetical protein
VIDFPTAHRIWQSLQINDNLVAVLFGIVSGAVGYWFTTFWMKPILQYRELRSSIFADMIFYAQVTNAHKEDLRKQQLVVERIAANRRHSA